MATLCRGYWGGQIANDHPSISWSCGRLSSRLALGSILSRLVPDRFQFFPSPSPPVPVFPVENVANGPETLLGTAIFSPRGFSLKPREQSRWIILLNRSTFGFTEAHPETSALSRFIVFEWLFERSEGFLSFFFNGTRGSL